MRFLTALGLRSDLYIDEKEAPGKYRLRERSDDTTVEVSIKDETHLISLPSFGSIAVDLHERSCECSLTQDPLTGSDLHPMRGCHHLRFADLRVLAAPETIRQVSHNFGTRLGAILDTFGASNLTEVRKILRDIGELPLRIEEQADSSSSKYSEANVDFERIDETDGISVVPHYSQERISENGEQYWIVRTEQDLLGGSSGQINDNG